jgi:hypothetical protein
VLLLLSVLLFLSVPRRACCSDPAGLVFSRRP